MVVSKEQYRKSLIINFMRFRVLNNGFSRQKQAAARPER